MTTLALYYSFRSFRGVLPIPTLLLGDEPKLELAANKEICRILSKMRKCNHKQSLHY